MPKNNGKRRKAWRKERAQEMDAQQRLLYAIFGNYPSNDRKPDTKDN